MEYRRIPTRAGGYEFTIIPEHVRSDLDTLTRECATYADYWIEEIGDFRHVRIEFTPEEREEFIRRSWAFELFLRAGIPDWAAETPGIDKDIGKEADSFSPRLKDGTIIPPPWHSFTAFLGPHLASLVCNGAGRQVVIELSGRDKLLFETGRAVQTLTATIRSFNRREKGLDPWKIACEDDVRDLLYVMLRPLVWDIIKEEPVPSKAGSHKFADFCSNGAKLLIELKWIGKLGTWRRRIEEIYVDMETYVTHPSSDNLWFVIVDDAKDIPDPQQIESELTGKRTIGGKEIDVRVFVCET